MRKANHGPPELPLNSTGLPSFGGAKPVSKNVYLAYAYGSNITAQEFPAVGSKSLFNEYSVFRYQTAAGDFKLLYDVEGEEGVTPLESQNPSGSSVIKWSQDNARGSWGSCPYTFSDFAYCTYYGLIPNNYLITLRRFPYPMLDNLRTSDPNQNVAPLAQALTWAGEETGNKFGEILKFACGINWKKIEAHVQEVSGNEKGFEASPLASVGGSTVLAGIQSYMNPREYSGLARSETEYAKELYGSEGPYANRVYGPVNVINETMARDQGLHFEGDITLNFHYSLKSIGSVNPKMAMLDILANLLTLTYNNAKFWGGAIRYFPTHPNVPFFGDQQKFYSGDVGGYIDSVVGQMQGMGGTFMDTFKSLLQDPIAALQKLATGTGTMIAGHIASKDRPQIIAMRSLLTGAPVGEWHLVVGNPMNPIAMIGNLICTDIEVEFGDVLGMDDFPTEMKATIKLKHGKPRDKGDIESMFNLGNGRLYYGIYGEFDASSMHNSNVDSKGGAGTVLNNTDAGSTGFITVNSDTVNTSGFIGANKLPGGTSIQSMWGGKFNPTELKIGKDWNGSAGAPEKK